MYHAIQSPIQGTHFIQASSRPIYRRLVIRNNHTENRDDKITGMNINVHAISASVNIQICTSIEDIKVDIL